MQAEARQLDQAAAGARAAVEASGGTLGPAWSLLALVLSAQQRVSEALAVSQEGLREADTREHPQLLAIQARLLVALGTLRSPSPRHLLPVNWPLLLLCRSAWFPFAPKAEQHPVWFSTFQSQPEHEAPGS